MSATAEPAKHGVTAQLLRPEWLPGQPTGRFWRRMLPAWLASAAVHAALLAAMALVVVSQPQVEKLLTLVAAPPVEEPPLDESPELNTAEMPLVEVGSASAGNSDATFAAAPQLGPVAAPLVAPPPVDDARMTEHFELAEQVREATGPQFLEKLTVKGAAGVGTTGTAGAVDRITQEILLSLEERPTLVAWFFDRSGSLARQRREIVERFGRIYEELGVIDAAGNPAFARHEDKPLLTTVVAFGGEIEFVLNKPTDDVGAILAAVSGLRTDPSGFERTFEAVRQAALRLRKYRTQEPRRNVMFVIFTDEVGDDESELDGAITLCRRLAIPVYCVGVPAPFGRREAYVKYVDPDPRYDQRVQWIPVRQGPESYQSELVSIGLREDEEPMDSGFGPYSLTRLCFETGGIYFAVHPNRDAGRRVNRRETAVLSAQLDWFFDPQVMLDYRPDYVPIREYQRLLAENKARASLVEAAQFASVAPLASPELEFPKVNDAELAARLTRAQRAAAILEPQIERLYQTLKQGEPDRSALTGRRWQAGYDLSMGRVLALKVRTEGYNTVLAKAKQGMAFERPNSDTWRLAPADEVHASGPLAQLAQRATEYLQRVVREHPGTPWALLARQELEIPFGWKWTEAYTGVNAPSSVAANADPPARAPQNDRPQMIRRPERRPPPKL